MREELKKIASELSQLCGGQSPYLLPFPYKRGHFRIYSSVDLPMSPDFTAVRSGSHLFVTITNSRLLRAMQEMDAAAGDVRTEPQNSPLDTLLYQILMKEYEMLEADCPELIRAVLDLDDDAERSRRVLEWMEPLLFRTYADALRENRQYSALSAVARQVVYHRNKHAIRLT